MAIRRNTFDLGDITEVEEYIDGRYGAPGVKRGRKQKATPGDVARINRWNKEKRCRRRLRLYFHENDVYATLTMKKELRPETMEDMKRIWRSFIAIVRKEYRRRGETLRWIRNIERGSRGAWHIHMAVNRIPDTDLIIKKAWREQGHINLTPMYTEGGFRELAAYLTKTEETDKGMVESSFDTSRNRPLPEPKKKLLTRKSIQAEPKPPKGYYVEKESVYEGVSATGFPFRYYTMIRIGGRFDRRKRE